MSEWDRLPKPSRILNLCLLRSCVIFALTWVLGWPVLLFFGPTIDMQAISAIRSRGSSSYPVGEPFVQDIWLGMVRNAAVAGLVLAAPFIILQIVAFCTSGFGRTRKGRIPWVTISVLAYFGGALISLLVLPYAFRLYYGVSIPHEGYFQLLDEATSFGLQLMAALGTCVQVSYLAIVMARRGILTLDTLRARAPLIVLALFAAAVVMPRFGLLGILDGMVFFYVWTSVSVWGAMQLVANDKSPVAYR